MITKALRWVYNSPIKKLVRRIKQIMMTNLFIAYGTMMIPIGFVLFGIYYVDPNHYIWLRIFAIIAWILGTIALFMAMKRADKDDKEAKTKFNQLIDTINNLSDHPLTSQTSPSKPQVKHNWYQNIILWLYKKAGLS